MYYVLCSMYYVQCTMYMMVPEMPALLSSQFHIHREQKQQSWNVFQLNQTKGIQWNAKYGECERRNIFRFCDSRQCVEIILRVNHYLHRHHHHNYHHHIDNNVFFIIIIRDVRRFTAMCWLSPTLSLASHLPDCLGISYFVFQIVFTLFLSVLKFHIILYCLFFLQGFVCLFTSKTGRATLQAITCFSSITSEGILTLKLFQHNWKNLPFVEKPQKLMD